MVAPEYGCEGLYNEFPVIAFPIGPTFLVGASILVDVLASTRLCWLTTIPSWTSYIHNI